MVDLNDEFILEHRIEARVSRLTHEVDSLIRLDAERFETRHSLLNLIKSIQNEQRELIFVVNKLTLKYSNFEEHYETLSNKVIRQIDIIQSRLSLHDREINDIAIAMQNLSLN